MHVPDRSRPAYFEAMAPNIPHPNDLLDLTGRVAIVTGASQGIGAGIAKRFATTGARVVVHYRRDRQAAKHVAAAIMSAGGTAVAISAKLDSEAGVRHLFAEADDRLGPVDILINNAGQNFPLHPLADISLDEWRAMFRDNLESMFLCTQAAAAVMRERGGGAIVNIGSISASNPASDHSHYNSAKAAVLAFTRSCAQEFGPSGIRVNSVSPGLIHKAGIEKAWPEGVERWLGKVPLGRLGQPDDIADACLLLASPAARWITGHNLVVDGGILSTRIY
jgi:NAD(P)-dependent dehydrogenase (short-subunit alcohol dehydrogenase family)